MEGQNIEGGKDQIPAAGNVRDRICLNGVNRENKRR